MKPGLWLPRLFALLCLLMMPALAAGESQPTETTVYEKVTTIKKVTTTTHETKKTQSKTRLAAIFVKNRAGKACDNKLGVFEDFITGHITDMGIQVMSSQDTIKSLQSYLQQPAGKAIAGDQLDQLLENNTSALRLAQNMGVDYLFVASIATFGKDRQHINRPDLGINRTVNTYKLRTTYKILDIAQGKSLSAGNILSTKRLQQAVGLSESSSDVIDDLLADAAKQIAAKLKAKRITATLADVAKTGAMANFSITCSMQDIMVPEVVKDKDGNFSMGPNSFKIGLLSVTVELDGVVIGTAPGTFQGLPGLHKIRLSREGFSDWARTINVRDGQKLDVALTLSPQGRVYWLEMARFFSKVKRDERLSDAHAEYVRGVAQKMRQSGFKVDYKADIKVDTKEAPVINQVHGQPHGDHRGDHQQPHHALSPVWP